ncbi:MAG: NAD-dependent epimerase/dehydratase family protein [Anaerolineales bacterium]
MNVVTGTFGYIGRHIARALLDAGEDVWTVTTHPNKPNPFGPAVSAYPFDFNHPEDLTDHLRGAKTLFNTYWIRFEHAGLTFDQALENTRTLLACARQAGVSRIVHISVTCCSLDDSLPYYRGKALQEQAVLQCGLPYAIIRPTLVFGPGDILVNNIAWLLRRFPLFPIFGEGDYRLQPVFVEDLATLAVRAARNVDEITIDAIGPETFTFEGFVRLMADHISPRTGLLHVPPGLGLAAGSWIGRLVGDVVLTENELKGLMQEKLTSNQAPNGKIRFSEWLSQGRDQLGRAYHSELARHFGPR